MRKNNEKISPTKRHTCIYVLFLRAITFSSARVKKKVKTRISCVASENVSAAYRAPFAGDKNVSKG